MAGNESLSQRIQAEFDSRAKRQKAEEQTRAQSQQEREKRLAQFNKVCDELKAIWRPRLEEFAKQFGDQVKLTPRVEPEQRQATMDFKTDLANVTLVLSAWPDTEVTKIVLDYALRIIPMFFDYERSAKLEMPLDKVDPAAVGKWVDDRLVACVKAYLSVQDNAYYQQRATVEDPITKRQFLRENAEAKLEHGGRTVYFSSQDSLKQYKLKHLIDQPAPTPQKEPAKAAPEKSGNGPANGSSAPAVAAKSA
jgi:YHS domain-containing protein